MEKREQNFINEEIKENKSSVKKLWISLLLVAVMMISFFCGYFARFSTQSESNKLINEIVKIIDENMSGSDGEKADEIARALVKTLLPDDEYAVYYSPEEYKALKEQNDGSYQGIGISFNDEGVISKVVWNSPAEHVGLEVGDKILKAKIEGQEYLVFENAEEIRTLLKECEKDSEILIVVSRAEEEKEFSVVKQEYCASYVKYYDSEKSLVFMGKDLTPTEVTGGKSALDEKTAFIKLSQFQGDAGIQMAKALEYMKERGRTKLVLDLRDNGGGSMEVLKEIATYLIYNKGNNYSQLAWTNDGDRINDVVINKNRFNEEITKISVLANQNTASASEVLIGAMLHDGNLGEGRFKSENLVVTYNAQRGNYSTFGKGIMQTIYPLSNGGALKLTTAQLLWPDRVTCIHNTGIVQDIPSNCLDSDDLAEQRAIDIVKD